MASRLEDGGHRDVEVGAIKRLQRSVLSQLGLQPSADCVPESLDNFALQAVLKWERVPQMESLVSENNQKNLEYLLRLSIHILYILMSPELPLLLASSLNSVNH